MTRARCEDMFMMDTIHDCIALFGVSGVVQVNRRCLTIAWRCGSEAYRISNAYHFTPGVSHLVY
jgi:hypothetical protein